MIWSRQYIHKVVLRLPKSWSNWNLEILVSEERGKPECLEKNLLEQRREPTTNSTQIWHRCQNLNLGHILVGGDGSHHFTIPCSSSLASSFCCTCTIYEILLIYLLWFNFVLGLNFIFFCFKLINTLHNHTERQRKIKLKPN